MFNLDSLTLKYFFEENFDFINGAIVQKIQLPSRNEIILNIRNLNSNNPQNKKLYININPKYPHICFIDEHTQKQRNIKIPSKPPMFCMQLRKYLNGSKIKDFKLVQYERILEFYFDYFDEIGSITKICLAVELMGKHSNIILYNAVNKIIIGSIHNISSLKSSIREVYGGINYIYPPIKEKNDILKISYSTFCNYAQNKSVKEVSDNFYYFSQGILDKVYQENKDTQAVFSFLQNLQNGNNKEFICKFWQNEQDTNINFSIDNYFSKIMFDEILKNKKQKLKSSIKNDYQKNLKIMANKPDSQKSQKYKLYGDLIMANLYLIKKDTEELNIDGTKIQLDKEISPAENAQVYYQKYKKEKTAFEYDTNRYNSASDKINYYDTVLLNIDIASDFEQLDEIEDEISQVGLAKKVKDNNIKTTIKKVDFMGYEIFIGKNNIQNDYLISKIAKDEDIWFHGQNYPSAHIILKIPNNKKEPSKEVIEYCAKLAKDNSKARDGGKAAIMMTKRKNLKKPPNTYPGYVTYKNEKEIVI